MIKGFIAGDRVKHSVLGLGMINRGNMLKNGTIWDNRKDVLVFFDNDEYIGGMIRDCVVCADDLELINKSQWREI